MCCLPTPSDATFLVWCWSRKRLYFPGVQCWLLDSVNLELGDRRVKTQTLFSLAVGFKQVSLLLDSALTVKLFQILIVCWAETSFAEKILISNSYLWVTLQYSIYLTFYELGGLQWFEFSGLQINHLTLAVHHWLGSRGGIMRKVALNDLFCVFHL